MSTRLHALQSQLAELTGSNRFAGPVARWEWPVETILADTDWWDRWLPRLHELLGRRLTPVVPRPADPATPPSDAILLDERGYLEIMTFLFPPVVRQGRRLTWRSPEYPIAVRAINGGRAGRHTVSRADVWEPVIRHVAEALSLLESTGQADSEAYMRLRAEAEITSSWTRVLLHLLGEDEPQLPRQQLA